MNKKECDRSLTEEIKALACKLGAEMVGVGPVERWKDAPPMLSPQGLLPTSKSVLTFGISFTDASMELTEKEMSEHWYNPYDMCENMTGMNDRLSRIAFNVTKMLESKGYRSLYSPVSNLWRIKPYKSIEHPFAPSLVHRYAAVACGLGEIGWSGLFLSPEFGSRQRVIPVVTEATLEPTPMYDGPRLCDKCMECVKRCPLDCFRKGVRKMNKINIGGRTFEFPDINKWRCFLDYFGISGPFVPDEIDEEVACRVAYSGMRPRESIMDSGACLCSCVPPSRRFKDPKYPRGVRRKTDKTPVEPQEVAEKLQAMTQAKGLDFFAIAGKEELVRKGIDLGMYLPDGASALAIGSRHAKSILGSAANMRLKECIFDLSHCLQRLGYATLPIPRLPVDSLAKALGFEEPDAQFTHLITELPLTASSYTAVNVKVEPAKISSEEIKDFAKKRGADLVGVSSARRLEAVFPSIKALYGNEKTIEVKREWVAGTPTAPIKEVALSEVKVRNLDEYLPGARSVIVLGVHYPATILERVAKPPAENVGTYAGATQLWGVALEMEALALDVTTLLRESGYKAEPVLDLFGTDYGVNAWGPREGSLSNRFAAVCAGLGEIGWNGGLLTPEYGLTQRSISVVTDAKLDEDPLYSGNPLCKKCLSCISACPVKALSCDEKASVTVDGRVFEFAKRDRLRCEWAVKCGLVGEEGPKYLGITKSFHPPEEITANAVLDALSQMDQVEQSWNATFEGCLSACPTTGETLDKRRGKS